MLFQANYTTRLLNLLKLILTGYYLTVRFLMTNSLMFNF